jgi:serine/threonine-protein kinase
MPICDGSLQDEINTRGQMEIEDALVAIRAIISGLIEVENITHRDLKPSNVLSLNGIWTIADFGIAKFVEDSTSMDTLRESLTPAYAAPEQWRGERPTSATDVYALGCIVHAVLEGHPPFAGSLDEIRESHLHSVPPRIERLSPRLATFVSLMLRKSDLARPTLQRCSEVFSSVDKVEGTAPSRKALIEAAGLIAAAEAKEEAERRRREAELREQERLFADARNEFYAIRDRLFQEIAAATDNVQVQSGVLTFGRAILRFDRTPERLNSMLYHSAVQQCGWDILGWTTIRLSDDNGLGYVGNSRSASLLFGRRKDDGDYRWYEVAFWSMYRDHGPAPFSLEGSSKELYLALGPVLHTVSIAYGPLPIDGEDEQAFLNRWSEWVARAAVGKLSRPAQMPMTSFD